MISYEKKGYVLPKMKDISWAYIRQILEGEKCLVKMSNDKKIIPPKISGFFTQEYWQDLKDD